MLSLLSLRRRQRPEKESLISDKKHRANLRRCSIVVAPREEGDREADQGEEKMGGKYPVHQKKPLECKIRYMVPACRAIFFHHWKKNCFILQFFLFPK